MNLTANATRTNATSIGANDVGLLLIRLMLGVVFMYHGSQKLFGTFGGSGIDGFAAALSSMNMPLPQAGAWAAALAEFGGGVILVLGLFMRVLILPTIFTMLVAAFGVHREAFSLQHGGMEYALTLAVVMIGLVLTGPGRFTVTRLVRGSKSRRVHGSSNE